MIPARKAPPSRQLPPPPTTQTSTKTFALSAPQSGRGHRVMLYGPGGIGKTTLACLAPGPVGAIDCEESLGVLAGQLEASGIPIPNVCNVTSFAETRSALQSEVFAKCKTIIIDSVTKLEDWVVAFTLKTVKGDKNATIHRLEDYGFGKGYQHVFETYLTLLGDLDRHVRAGRNVILIAHECVTNVPNPNGGDWIRYEPRLQDLKSGKSSIRLRTKEWSDHTLFLSYDIAEKDGKAVGQGTRSLHTAERPFCMAKSRTTSDQFAIALGSSPWGDILK